MEERDFAGAIRSKKRNIVLCAILGVVLLFAGVIMIPLEKVPLGIAGIAVGIGLFIYSAKLSKDLKKFAAPLVQSVLEEKLEVESYEPTKYFDRKLVKDTKLFTGWSSITGSDLVTAKYRGISLSFCDLDLTHEESSGKDSTTTITDFEGVFMEVTTHRSVGSPVWVKEQGKGLFNSKVIEMESETFNKKFTVTGDSTQDAFYVLTPHFMETLIRADKYANARTQMLFRDNKIYIGLYNSKDLCEMKGQKTMDGMRASLESDLRYITDYMDILLENTALFDPGRMN